MNCIHERKSSVIRDNFVIVTCDDCGRETLRFKNIYFPEEARKPPKWVEKKPTSYAARKKGPYEFCSNIEHPDIENIINKIRSSGRYAMPIDVYLYWLMRGGLARRKIKEVKR